MNLNYDLISSIYDFDMALNMPFDDVQFYLNRFRNENKILEIGCGTGRITIPLHHQCYEILAIDSSLPMLRQLRIKLDNCSEAINSISIAVMDAKYLATKDKFDRIFFAFSGINYLSNPEDVKRFLVQIKNNLNPNGKVLLDAFIPPKNTMHDSNWRDDYQRILPDGKIIKRSKQIKKLESVNQVRRRYDIYRDDGKILSTINTISIIHPYTPDELRSLFENCGYKVIGEWWDYEQSLETSANFFTLEATPINSASTSTTL